MGSSGGGGGRGGRGGGGGSSTAINEQQLTANIESGKISSDEFHAMTDALSRSQKTLDNKMADLIDSNRSRGVSRSETRNSDAYKKLESDKKLARENYFSAMRASQNAKGGFKR